MKLTAQKRGNKQQQSSRTNRTSVQWYWVIFLILIICFSALIWKRSSLSYTRTLIYIEPISDNDDDIETSDNIIILDSGGMQEKQFYFIVRNPSDEKRFLSSGIICDQDQFDFTLDSTLEIEPQGTYRNIVLVSKKSNTKRGIYPCHILIDSGKYAQRDFLISVR